MRWSLRKRFASARRYRTQRSWPYTPYRATMSSCKQFDYDEVTTDYGLTKPKPKPKPKARRSIGLEGHESVRDLRANLAN
jgi:hypothetical protein